MSSANNSSLASSILPLRHISTKRVAISVVVIFKNLWSGFFLSHNKIRRRTKRYEGAAATITRQLATKNRK
jgi:hypothetical protein